MRPQENPIISEIRVLIEEYEQVLSEKASGTQATEEQWDVIADLTSHDLQRDFAYRAREAGWSLEEV